MKAILKLAMILIAFYSSAQQQTLETTTIQWTGKAAFNSYELSGTLKTKTGILEIKNDSIKQLVITIDMKSLDHKNKDLKKHLRSKDFFEIKTYHEATFTLTKPAAIIDGKANLIGNMIIKDKTKQETIPVNVKMLGNKTCISLNCTLNRIAYGITFNSPTVFEKIKENAIADNFKLKAELKFK